MKKKKEEEELDLDNDFLPSGGFILRKRGEDYEMFPEDQIMWRAKEDWKIMWSLMGSLFLIILIIIFFSKIGDHIIFGFGNVICGIFFSIVGAWHEFSINGYKCIKPFIISGIKIGFIIGIVLYNILYYIYI